MALAGLADYGSSSEDEEEQQKVEEAKLQPPPSLPVKKKSLLPSANDLFASIDGPAFMGGGGAVRTKRTAQEISATRPSLQVPSSSLGTQPPSQKRLAAAGPSKEGNRSAAKVSAAAKGKTGSNGMLLPPQVSRPGGRGNVVTEDVSAWTSKAGLAKADGNRRKEGEGARRRKEGGGEKN
ncbi:Hypothetical protein NocV09_00303390 [Nannochloropsis oceanica]